MLVSKLAMIFLFLGLGAVLRRLPGVPRRAPVLLNRFVLFVSLPAVTLLQIHSLTHLEGLPVAMAWIVFGAAGAVFLTVARVAGLGRGELGCLMLTAGLGNTSFVGFPLIEALFGREALGTAVLNDQPGSFLVLSTLGIGVAAFCSGRRFNVVDSVKRIFTFPPVLALLAALALRPVAYPAWLTNALLMLGAALSPAALTAVGFQLRLDRAELRARRVAVLTGLGYKLVLAPAVMLAIYFFSGRQPLDQAAVVTIMESAMGPMITGAVVASEYGLAPDLASLMVSLGIPISFLTLALWFALLH